MPPVVVASAGGLLLQAGHEPGIDIDAEARALGLGLVSVRLFDRAGRGAIQNHIGIGPNAGCRSMLGRLMRTGKSGARESQHGGEGEEGLLHLPSPVSYMYDTTYTYG
ncbi:hypothetical protein MPL3356_80071 [Mesorhizobium plurifarium]|uniref:Uncharacterized protein n=1 Tax=Mesorhizobium plurifarium TaxID=69974 RepID=A0A090EIA9_MESPL|nr:hypothetical protein MPL3356_80071 [Mesorhizobium plurifarium]